MTLVLAVTTPETMYHVSDRQVTSLRTRGATSVHSSVENKTLIFICKDAVGTIGYTGVAYIDGQPTDQWLANILAPQPAGAPSLGNFAFGGRGMGAIRLQTLIWRLRNALGAARLPLRAQFLEVGLSGFRIRRHRCVPFHVKLAWKRSDPQISGFMRRARSLDERCVVTELGDVFPHGQVIQQINTGAVASSTVGPHRLLAGMVHAVRVRSTQTKTVGANLMTVVIPHPALSREIVWKFEPATLHNAQLVSGKQSLEFPAVYSPWILTPVSVSCPTVGTGGLSVHANGWTVTCSSEAPTSPRGILFAASHQERTKSP